MTTCKKSGLRVRVHRASAALCLGLAIVALAAPAEAQPPGLALVLTPSHQVIAPGGTLRVTVGAVNQGPPVAMDVYFVVLLPDGDSVVVPRGDGSFAAGRLSQLAALPRLAAGVTLPTGFAQSLDDVVVYTFNGSEPWGLYRWYFAAVRPGALADGRVDGDDLLALATAEVLVGPPIGVLADVARGVSGEVTPTAGGTVQATGADGTTYMLVVPPGAVGRPTTVTLTPVTAVTGVPGANSLLAAVQGGPAGLQFAIPARLTIEIPGGVPPAAGLGVLVADDGTSAELLPLATGATRLEVEVSHFSTVVVPATAEELAAQFGTSGFYPAAVTLQLQATLLSPPDPGTTLALLDHLIIWYDTQVRPLLDAGQSEDFALLAGLRELQQWDERRAALEQCCGEVTLGLNRPVRGRLNERATEGRALAVTGLAEAFTRANDACLTSTAGVTARLGLAEEAASYQTLASSYFQDLDYSQSLKPDAIQIPAPDLATHGLDNASVAARFCVKVTIDEVIVPDLSPNQTGTLVVVAGVSFDGGPTQFTTSMAVAFAPNPGAPGVPPSGGGGDFVRTNAAGQASLPVTASANGVVRYLVCGAVHPSDFIGVFIVIVHSAITTCRASSGGVVVTPSQTEILPGESRQFSAVVEDTFNQAVSWSVSGGGAITQTGLFTSNGALGTFFVTATSVVNPDSVGIAQVTVAEPGGGGELIVSPTGELIPRGGTRQFFAASEGGALVPVTWSVDGGGTISADGLFTAGDTATTGFQLVKATSIADPSVTGTASVAVTTLRVGRYTSTAAEVQFFQQAGPCGDPNFPKSFPDQPRSWTLDVASLPTAPWPFMVTVTNVDPGAAPVRYDFLMRLANGWLLGKGIDDPTHTLELAHFDGGAIMKYYKLASNDPFAALVAVQPPGVCPTDLLSYPARLWTVGLRE